MADRAPPRPRIDSSRRLSRRFNQCERPGDARFLCGQHGRRRRGVGSRTPAASCRIAATSGQPGCRTLGTFGPPRPQGGGEEPRRGSGGHYATTGGAGGSSAVALAQEFTSARGMISTSTSSPLSSMVATCPIFLLLPTMVGLPGLTKRTSSWVSTMTSWV